MSSLALLLPLGALVFVGFLGVFIYKLDAKPASIESAEKQDTYKEALIVAIEGLKMSQSLEGLTGYRFKLLELQELGIANHLPAARTLKRIEEILGRRI